MGVFGFRSLGHRELRLPCPGRHQDGSTHLEVAQEAHELLTRARSYRESGQLARAQQKARAALQVVRRSLRQHPKSCFLGRFLCGIYYELRDFSAAENCLEHLIESLSHEPAADLTEPYTRLGIIKWYHRKDVVAATRYFELALSAVRRDTDPDTATEPHLHLARIYLETNAPELAREHASKRLAAIRSCQQAAILYELVSESAETAPASATAL